MKYCREERKKYLSDYNLSERKNRKGIWRRADSSGELTEKLMDTAPFPFLILISTLLAIY